MKIEQRLLLSFHNKVKRFFYYRTYIPQRPLRTWLMDVKNSWTVRHCLHAYMLSIDDVFSRFVLYWRVSFAVQINNEELAWIA